MASKNTKGKKVDPKTVPIITPREEEVPRLIPDLTSEAFVTELITKYKQSPKEALEPIASALHSPAYKYDAQDAIGVEFVLLLVDFAVERRLTTAKTIRFIGIMRELGRMIGQGQSVDAVAAAFKTKMAGAPFTVEESAHIVEFFTTGMAQHARLFKFVQTVARDNRGLTDAGTLHVFMERVANPAPLRRSHTLQIYEERALRKRLDEESVVDSKRKQEQEKRSREIEQAEFRLRNKRIEEEIDSLLKLTNPDQQKGVEQLSKEMLQYYHEKAKELQERIIKLEEGMPTTIQNP